MVGLLDLWLPILLSAVFVFVVSSIIHMVVPFHKGDYKKLSDEAGLLGAMREHGVKPGQYMFPCPDSMKEMGTPEMMEKYQQGPVGYMNIMPNGPLAMGKNLLLWFVYSVVVGVFVAYVGKLSLDAGAGFMEAFRLTGTTAVLGYALASVPDSIWKGVSWTVTAKFVLDGVLYGLVTGLAFGWLWPGATQ